jgi:hypothetical protein
MAGRNLVTIGSRFDNKVSPELSKLKGQFDGLGSAAKTGFGLGVGIKAFNLLDQAISAVIPHIFEAIENAARLEQAQAKSDAVFKSSADEVEAWSKTTADAFGISQRAALESAAGFGNLFKSMGLAEEQSKDMSIALVNLSADLAAFNNLPTDQVLAKLQSGIIGNVKSVRSLGVTWSAESVAQKAVELGFAKTTKAVSEQAKVQARYAIIMEQTTIQQGQAAREGKSLEMIQAKLGARVEEMSASFGEVLLPVLVQLGGLILQYVLPAIAQFADILSKTLVPAIVFVAGVFDSFVKAIDLGIARLIVAFIQLNDFIGSIPGPWHHAADEIATSTGTMADLVAGHTHNLAGKVEDDMTAYGRSIAAAATATAHLKGKVADDTYAIRTSIGEVATKTQTTRLSVSTQLRLMRAAFNTTRSAIIGDARDIVTQALDVVDTRVQLSVLNAKVAALEKIATSRKLTIAEKNDLRSLVGQQAQAVLDLAEAGAGGSATVKAAVTDMNKALPLVGAHITRVVGAVNEALHRMEIKIRADAIALARLKAGIPYADYTPPGYPLRAAGGPVSARQPYVVGEKGPELFVPNNSGNIIPNSGASGGGPGWGGGGSTVVFQSLWPPTPQMVRETAKLIDAAGWSVLDTAAPIQGR